MAISGQELSDMPDTYHVIPTNDLREHTNNSDYCQCLPRVDVQDNGGKVVVHNSYDGREFFETDEALLDATL